MAIRQRSQHPTPADSGPSAPHLIWGYHAVLEAIRAQTRPLHKILIAQGGRAPRFAELIGSARAAGVLIQRVRHTVLDQLTRGQKHQGVVAVVAAKAYIDAEEILRSLSPDSLLLLLDQIRDPQNVGAVIRTACCAGADAVILTTHHSAGLSEVVAKVSAGGLEYIPVARVVNLGTFIDRLKQAGAMVIGVDPSAPTEYIDVPYSGPLAFVFGSEGKGLRRLTRARCDELVSIPMRGKIGSLNVSVCVGIVLFEVLRQRSMSG